MDKIAKVEKPAGLFSLEGISCLCFNKDFTKVALSKKDNLIYIYEIKDLKNSETWRLVYTLKAHVGFVSDIDWNANSNDILTVSHDKTAYIWTFTAGKWESSALYSNVKLGYVCCKWNDRGDKFCTGTSGKNLLIGYFNTENNWWMAMPISKAHKSTVTTCMIDPTSLLVLSGSTDFRVFMHSCYIEKVDEPHLTEQTRQMISPFGTLIYEFKANTWVNEVKWNSTGTLGYAACQNSTITVINWMEQSHEVVNETHSPAYKIIPKGEDAFYVICYDRNIYLYQKKDGKWEKTNTITEPKEAATPAAAPKVQSSIVANRLKHFQASGAQKKENLIVKAKQSKNLHTSLIVNGAIKDKTLVTTDLGGFVKTWGL